MKIVIMGAPVNCGNRGVLALGASLVNLCAQAANGSEVVLLLGNKDSKPVALRVGGVMRNIPVVNARMSPRCRISEHFFIILLMSLLYRLIPVSGMRKFIANKIPWIKTAIEADIIGDVHGGDSFSDIYGLNRFVMGFLSAWTVILVKGTLIQFPQTYGPFKSPIVRLMARYLLYKSKMIIARDKQSQTVAQSLVGPHRKVLISPDVAFSLEAISPQKIEMDPNGLKKNRVVGINVNGLMYNGGYTRKNMFGLKMEYKEFLRSMIIALLAVSQGDIWLIPHTYAPPNDVESDLDASFKVRDALPPETKYRVHIITKEYDQHELKGIIGLCDFFIGSRMHACIAALSQGIPCVGVAYSMKFSGVFDSVGMGNWVIDGRTVEHHEAVEKVVTLYEKRDREREGLRLRAEQARKILWEVFKQIVVECTCSNAHLNVKALV